MKKIIGLVLFLCIILMTTSCSNKKGIEEENVKREVSSKIDMDLVEKLEGSWVSDSDANYPAQGKRFIIRKKGYVFYDNNKLQIVNTVDDVILTQTEEDKPFYYDFKIDGNKLTVYPSYPVPEGMTGGDLAPREYMRDDEINTDTSLLFGEWQSIDEPEIYYISIGKVSDSIIKYADNLEYKDSQILIEQKSSKDSISTLTEDERAIYHFRMLESETIEAYSQVNENYYTNRGEDIPVGMSKPIKYKKIIK